MNNKHKAALAAISLTSALLYYTTSNQHPSQTRDTPEPAIATESTHANNNPTANTVKDLWDWDNLELPEGASATASSSTDADTQFDIQKIHDALQALRVDSYGDIITDDLALAALNQAFQHGRITLDEQSMTKFLTIIRAALPNQTGDQAAEIAKNYHDYLQARTDLFAYVSAKDQQAAIEDIIALQSLYLGNQVARDLFRTENANAHYMMAAFEVEQDESLTLAEKQARQEALTEQYAGDQHGIEHWQSRYQQFKAEKAILEEAGYSSAETKRQIYELLNYHFSEDEQKRLAQLNLWH